VKVELLRRQTPLLSRSYSICSVQGPIARGCWRGGDEEGSSLPSAALEDTATHWCGASRVSTWPAEGRIGVEGNGMGAPGDRDDVPTERGRSDQGPGDRDRVEIGLRSGGDRVEIGVWSKAHGWLVD